jgi:hypothetical protein
MIGTVAAPSSRGRPFACTSAANAEKCGRSSYEQSYLQPSALVKGASWLIPQELYRCRFPRRHMQWSINNGR